MSKKGVENKNRFLGMPYGTACNRLRKIILFDLLKKLDENFCYRCGKTIKNINDLSIEHKKPWLWVDKKLFWDLENVAFSHLKCNVIDRPRGLGKNCKEGFHWCNACKKCLPIKLFGKSSRFSSGLKSHCKNCRRKAGWGHPERLDENQSSL